MVVRNYAEQYQPNPKRIDNLQMPPHEVTGALNALSNFETRQHEPYVVLILLKIYRNHYEHAHQSYELREGSGGKGEAKNPILREYCRLVGLNPRAEEFLPSGHVYGWIEKHPQLLQYTALSKEYSATKKLVDYWERQFEQQIKEHEKKKGI